MLEARPIEAPIELPDELPVDIVILPRTVQEGVGLYDDSVAMLAKELAAQGVQAHYLHPTDSREWIGEMGIDPVVLDLMVGIASNAGWDGIVAFLRGRPSERVRARVARCKQRASGETEWEWVEVDGPGAEIAEVLGSLHRSDGPDADSDEHAA